MHNLFAKVARHCPYYGLYMYIHCNRGFVLMSHPRTDSQINIILLSEQLMKRGAIVTLGWTQEGPNTYYSYNVSINPHVEYNITYFSENTRIQLNLSYNTFYNVNVIASSPCGRINDFIRLHYGN